MINPTEALVFSMHANPGIYAVLAGSGVSRAAKIPTGWEITLDLVRQLAALRKETCEPDPERWYQKAFSKKADYSDLLERLCATRAERQQLLRGYFEPSADDREEGAKQPTAAHRSIAALAAKGFIRVILTTNFDRLIQTALDDAGVTPRVLSTPDEVQGALPLVHTRCCVVKLHGDYLDPGIRNTQAELDSYPAELNRLLDRVFDEFGLIVCGWSATWDGALRKALQRASSRRFTTYWAVHGKVEDEARRLIEHRAAQSVSIKDADEFFSGVEQQVESLREFARPHPLSTEAAVSSLKRYLSKSQHRIRLSDLVDGVVEQVTSATCGEEFSVSGPKPDATTVTTRIRRYETASSTLLALAPVGGFWASDDHVFLWERALGRLGATPPIVSPVYDIWEGLRRYPATLLLYGLGIGAVEANQLGFLGRLLKAAIPDERSEEKIAAQVLPAAVLSDRPVMLLPEGMEKRLVRMSDRIHDALRQTGARVIPDDSRYRFVFDKLEFLLALGYVHVVPEQGWAPVGAFGYRNDNRKRIVQEIEASLSRTRNESPFVTCRIFGDTEEMCRQRLATLRDLIGRTGRW